MDVFPTSLSRHDLFRAELTTAAASITAGCAFQKPERTTSSTASLDTQAILEPAAGFTIQSLVPLETGFWGSEFGYAKLPLRLQPDDNPTGWLLRDAVNESSRTWRPNLKEGITSQNGNPLGTDQLTTPMTWHLANNRTATEQLPGATVVVDQDKSLLPTTQAPTPGLRNILANEAYFTVLDLPSYEGTGDDPQKLIDARIYTDPYVPASLSDEKLVMTTNPTYWNGAPGLGEVKVFFVPDAGARTKAVQNGEVDIALCPPTRQAKSLKSDTRAKFNLGEPGGPSFCLTVNVAKPVLAEVKVRHALLRLVNYGAPATDVIQGFYELVSSFYDPRLPYAINIWGTDVAEAEQLLGEAGATKSDNGWLLSSGEPIAFELLTYPQQPGSDTLVLASQTQFKEHGIRATIRQVSDTAAEVESSNWDIGVVNDGAISFGGNPIPPLQRYYHTDGNRNCSHISDPELDVLVDELAVTLNGTVAKNLLVKVQRRIGDQDYNGFCGRRRPATVAGQRMPKCTPQHTLIQVNASIRVGA